MKGNTIDLEGHEQICTRKHAEEYASFLGYQMFKFNSEIYDVDPEAFKSLNFLMNPLVGVEEVRFHTVSLLVSKEDAISKTEQVEPVSWNVRGGLTVIRDGYLSNGVRIHIVKEPGFNGNCINNALVYSL